MFDEIETESSDNDIKRVFVVKNLGS